MCIQWTRDILHRNIDQALVNSLHRQLNCKMGGFECHVITVYRTFVHCTHM